MKVRLVPLVLALLFPVLVYQFYISPTTPTLVATQAELLYDQTQYDALSSASTVEPRIRDEETGIAKRLGRIAIVPSAQAEATFVRVLADLAQANHVTVIGLQAKGTEPLQFAAGAAGAPGVSVLPASIASQIPSNVPGSTAPQTTAPDAAASPVPGAAATAPVGTKYTREITIQGKLTDILLFTDAVGAVSMPIAVRTYSLTQGDHLSAVLTIDLLAFSPDVLRSARTVDQATLSAVVGGKT